MTLLPALILAAVSATCETHTPCHVQKDCGCQVPARSAAGGYFYWDIEGFVPGSKVRCNFTSWPVGLWPQVEASSLPTGVTMGCGECRVTPLDITFDVAAMEDDQGIAMLKWYIPPTDMSTRAELSCRVE